MSAVLHTAVANLPGGAVHILAAYRVGQRLAPDAARLSDAEASRAARRAVTRFRRLAARYASRVLSVRYCRLEALS